MTGPRPRDRRARIRDRCRLAARACLLAPGAIALLVDIARRAPRIFGFGLTHALAYWPLTILMVLVWAALLSATAVRDRRVRYVAAGLFTALYAFSTGTQTAFFSRYNVYASYDTSLYSSSFPLALVAAFPQGVAVTLAAVLACALIAIALVIVTRAFVRPRRRWSRRAPIAAALLVVVGFATPVSFRASTQATPPDLIYFHSLARYVNERGRSYRFPANPTLVRVQRRSPEPLPRIDAAPFAPRNVLFILQEAQRADVTCTAYTRDCELATRATNPLLPRRFPFLEMRAAASSTAVAISNLWAGVDPMESYEVLHSTPLVWEYARAAGYDTAYWTSQNLMFGNARLYLQDAPISHFVLATHLDPTSDTLTGAKDASLSDYVIKHWADLEEPFFAVVHYSNLHRPRRVEKKKSPFQPSADKSVSTEEGQNHYKNAVYLSDLAVAKLLKHVRSTPSGKRTVIVYTSDHAEAMLEHDNENDHSSTVFDEEIHVPAWIDGAEGTLSASERTSLAEKRFSYVFQYDLAATVLDLLGLWDSPAFQPYRQRIIGLPLTRRELYDKPVPLTNVSWVWEYHLPNWGMMLGSRKVIARAEDPNYLCFDVADDPEEKDDLGEAACSDLVDAANERFRILPRDMPSHMRSRPDIWGPWPPSPAP